MWLNMVSIIVPVYKVEKYLCRCIESIIAQTLPDFELILVDDGSPDNCGVICDEYSKKDTRVKVIHKPNGGVSSARNVGLDAAKGDYIAFVDSDDWIHPQMLDILYHSIIQTDAGFCACKVKKVFDEDNSWNADKVHDICVPQVYNGTDVLKDYFLKYSEKLKTFVYNKLYRRECFDNLRFDCQMGIYEDEMVALELIEAAEKVAFVNYDLYYYFQSENSLVRSKYNLKRLQTFCSLQHLIDFMEQHGCYDQVDELERRWLIAFLDNYYVIQQDYPEFLPEIISYKKHYLRKVRGWMGNRRVSRMYKVVVILFAMHPLLSRRLYLYLRG